MSTIKATNWREVRRRRAWDLKQQGWKQRDIATALGLTEGVVSQWLKLARDQGEHRLAARKASGRPPRLTAAQRQQIPLLLTKVAEAHGFRGDLSTRRLVATVLQREFGVKHCLQHVGTLLRRCGCRMPNAIAAKSPKQAQARTTRRAARIPSLRAPETSLAPHFSPARRYIFSLMSTTPIWHPNGDILVRPLPGS